MLSFENDTDCCWVIVGDSSRCMTRPSVMFQCALPSLTVAVGIALGVVSTTPFRERTVQLLPALVTAAIAPLAASLLLAVLASGIDMALVSTAGMLCGLGIVNLFLASLTPGPDQ